MKKIIIILITVVSIKSYSQTKTVSVEKSIYGIQTGFLGIWANTESKLSDKIVLKSEIGLDFSAGKTIFDEKFTFLAAPSITLEPRFYYNLNKRLNKNKNISNNSGNYISIRSTFNPDWFVISNKDNVLINNQLRIVPSWGIKRVYGKYFTLETGAGVGFQFIENTKNNTYLDLHFRIGYTF
jgi:hypothetical protein